jgi:hypothetical protein
LGGGGGGGGFNATNWLGKNGGSGIIIVSNGNSYISFT